MKAYPHNFWTTSAKSSPNPEKPECPPRNSRLLFVPCLAGPTPNHQFSTIKHQNLPAVSALSASGPAPCELAANVPEDTSSPISPGPSTCSLMAAAETRPGKDDRVRKHPTPQFPSFSPSLPHGLLLQFARSVTLL